jgi:hypothetical protein
VLQHANFALPKQMSNARVNQKNKLCQST